MAGDCRPSLEKNLPVLWNRSQKRDGRRTVEESLNDCRQDFIFWS